MEEDGPCTLCGESLGSEDRATVSRGLPNMIAKSQSRGDGFWQSWENKDSVTVHETCRRRYSALRMNPPKKKPRLEVVAPEADGHQEPAVEITCDFDFSTLCVMCGRLLDRHHKVVRTMRFESISSNISLANSRNESDIVARLNYVLWAKDVTVYYHDRCTLRPIYVSQKVPREVDHVVESAFENVATYIETSGEHKFSLKELRQAMGTASLTNYTLFKKLEEKFGEDITIIQHIGRAPLFLYKTQNFFRGDPDEWMVNPASLSDGEKQMLIDACAEILHNDAKAQQYDPTIHQVYSPEEEFHRSVVTGIPNMLQRFLDRLLLNSESDKTTKANQKKSIHVNTITHSIVSFLRPRSFMSTWQLAIGTYFFKKTGSRLIVDLLYRLGVSSSYYTIQKYEASVINDPPAIKIEDNFFQCVFNNTDNGVVSVDQNGDEDIVVNIDHEEIIANETQDDDVEENDDSAIFYALQLI